MKIIPRLLREIYDPPLVLYVKGELTAKDKNAVAMVGSRQTTHYGIETARKLAYQLAYVGVTVVSGGARGIDTAAHQGALEREGPDDRRVGNGHQSGFPAGERGIVRAHCGKRRGHHAISVQSPGGQAKLSHPQPHRRGHDFGHGGGRGESDQRRAHHGEYGGGNGRQIFAVPGRIDSPRSKGCHDLIKKGAKLCEGAEDILSEFEYLFPASNRPPSPGETGVLPALEISENEQKVFDALKAGEESAIDEVIRASGLPSSAVSRGVA